MIEHPCGSGSPFPSSPSQLDLDISTSDDSGCPPPSGPSTSIQRHCGPQGRPQPFVLLSANPDSDPYTHCNRHACLSHNCDHHLSSQSIRFPSRQQLTTACRLTARLSAHYAHSNTPTAGQVSYPGFVASVAYRSLDGRRFHLGNVVGLTGEAKEKVYLICQVPCGVFLSLFV